MAIIRELKKVDNNKYKFNKLYVNPDKECAIYFKGILPLKVIQAFFFNLRDNVTSSSRIEAEGKTKDDEAFKIIVDLLY